MALEITLEKYTTEKKVLFDFDFTEHPNIKAGQLLSGIPAISFSAGSGLNLDTAVLSADQKKVQVALSDGNAGTHTIQCEIGTNGPAGTKIKICGKLTVKSC